VLSPLAGPIAISTVVALFWMTLDPTIQIDRKVILDITPWALIFFSVALIGGGFVDIWPVMALRQVVLLSLLALAVAVVLYAGATVIFRLLHPHDEPAAGVWIATFFLLGASVVICHEAA
jgi:hypothetical protein